MFQQFQKAIQHKKLPCFAGHIRTHSSLPGLLTKGNALVDNLAKIIALSQFKLDPQLHAIHHKNSSSLKK